MGKDNLLEFKRQTPGWASYLLAAWRIEKIGWHGNQPQGGRRLQSQEESRRGPLEGQSKDTQSFGWQILEKFRLWLASKRKRQKKRKSNSLTCLKKVSSQLLLLFSLCLSPTK